MDMIDDMHNKDIADMGLKDEFLHALFMLKGIHPNRFKFDLSMPAFMLLKQLQKRETKGETGGAWLSEMKDYLCVSKAAVSQMLGSLENRGLVTREADPENRRTVIVRLTPEGIAKVERIERIFDESIDMLVGSLGEKDTREMIRLIYRIKDIIPDIQKEIEARVEEK